MHVGTQRRILAFLLAITMISCLQDCQHALAMGSTQFERVRFFQIAHVSLPCAERAIRATAAALVSPSIKSCAVKLIRGVLMSC